MKNKQFRLHILATTALFLVAPAAKSWSQTHEAKALDALPSETVEEDNLKQAPKAKAAAKKGSASAHRGVPTPVKTLPSPSANTQVKSSGPVVRTAPKAAPIIKQPVKTALPTRERGTTAAQTPLRPTTEAQRGSHQAQTVLYSKENVAERNAARYQERQETETKTSIDPHNTAASLTAQHGGGNIATSPSTAQTVEAVKPYTAPTAPKKPDAAAQKKKTNIEREEEKRKKASMKAFKDLEDNLTKILSNTTGGPLMNKIQAQFKASTGIAGSWWRGNPSDDQEQYRAFFESKDFTDASYQNKFKLLNALRKGTKNPEALNVIGSQAVGLLNKLLQDTLIKLDDTYENKIKLLVSLSNILPDDGLKTVLKASLDEASKEVIESEAVSIRNNASMDASTKLSQLQDVKTAAAVVGLDGLATRIGVSYIAPIFTEQLHKIEKRIKTMTLDAVVGEIENLKQQFKAADVDWGTGDSLKNFNEQADSVIVERYKQTLGENILIIGDIDARDHALAEMEGKVKALSGDNAKSLAETITESRHNIASYKNKLAEITATASETNPVKRLAALNNVTVDDLGKLTSFIQATLESHKANALAAVYVEKAVHDILNNSFTVNVFLDDAEKSGIPRAEHGTLLTKLKDIVSNAPEHYFNTSSFGSKSNVLSMLETGINTLPHPTLHDPRALGGASGSGVADDPVERFKTTVLQVGIGTTQRGSNLRSYPIEDFHETYDKLNMPANQKMISEMSLDQHKQLLADMRAVFNKHATSLGRDKAQAEAALKEAEKAYAHRVRLENAKSHTGHAHDAAATYKDLSAIEPKYDEQWSTIYRAPKKHYKETYEQWLGSTEFQNLSPQDKVRALENALKHINENALHMGSHYIPARDHIYSQITKVQSELQHASLAKQHPSPAVVVHNAVGNVVMTPERDMTQRYENAKKSVTLGKNADNPEYNDYYKFHADIIAHLTASGDPADLKTAAYLRDLLVSEMQKYGYIDASLNILNTPKANTVGNVWSNTFDSQVVKVVKAADGTLNAIIDRAPGDPAAFLAQSHANLEAGRQKIEEQHDALDHHLDTLSSQVKKHLAYDPAQHDTIIEEIYQEHANTKAQQQESNVLSADDAELRKEHLERMMQAAAKLPKVPAHEHLEEQTKQAKAALDEHKAHVLSHEQNFSGSFDIKQSRQNVLATAQAAHATHQELEKAIQTTRASLGSGDSNIKAIEDLHQAASNEKPHSNTTLSKDAAANRWAHLEAMEQHINNLPEPHRQTLLDQHLQAKNALAEHHTQVEHHETVHHEPVEHIH